MSPRHTPSTPPLRVRLAALGLTIAAAVFTLAAADGGDRSLEALEAGNAAFLAGDLDRALGVYQRAWSPQRAHPTLIYNLGTTWHHKGDLPQAVLWYRRGDADDPWLQENLWLARRSLGSERLPPAGVVGWLSHRHRILSVLAIACAWSALLALALPRPAPRAALLGAGLGVLLYAGAWAADRWGPQPGVVLEVCDGGATVLPAGTEAWVRRSGDIWRVAGVPDARCGADTVALVHP
ncbi:MAG: hypothetical protein AAGC60_19020 [Acidobacteriota bacterium]